MKIISWNINGIRAVYQKGFLSWLKKEKADIVCLQEIKASIDKIPLGLKKVEGYFCYFNPSQRPGYAGTAVLSRQKPIKVEQGIGLERFDNEGRVLKLTYPGFVLFNFYMVNGGRKQEHMKYKLASYDYVFKQIRKESDSFQKEKEGVGLLPVLLVGDFNIAHKEIDLARPKENAKNTGFTPKEREKIDQLLKLGFVDSFRKFYPQKTGQYTWWTHWANARERNLGWRIDYCFVSENLSPCLKKAFILPEAMGSDHCPVGIRLKI